MKRRGFLATVLGALCAPFASKVLPLTGGTGLMWHKDAFSMAMEPLKSIESTTRGSEVLLLSGHKAHIYRSEDVGCSVEEFAERCRPHLEVAQRQLAEAIDATVKDARRG